MQADPMVAMMAIGKSLNLNDRETQPDGLGRSLDCIVLRTYGADLMDATELLKELEKHDIIFLEKAGRWSLRAPRGSLTDDLHRRIDKHKEELVEILRSESPSPEPAAAPLVPEGRVGEHRAPCPTCGDTWCWPTVSSETGELGWVCARCFTASLSSPKDLLILPAGDSAPISPLRDTRLRTDSIPSHKGGRRLDTGNGSDRHHPEALELDEFPYRWRNPAGVPSRIHQYQCPLCHGAQMMQTDTPGVWYCGTCHSIRRLIIGGETSHARDEDLSDVGRTLAPEAGAEA
jgi:hypothetical protein